MPDFTLEPDEIESENPRPVRITSAGLAPTADLPKQRRAPDTPPCLTACECCGVEVLFGQTLSGLHVAIELTQRTYTVLWEAGAALPTLHESRGYPVHVCPAIRRETR